MTENRLRRLISQLFPHQGYEEIMAILESRGKSRSTVRDASDFITLIEISEGSLSTLDHYVHHATEEDLNQLSSWLHARVDYLTRLPEPLSFFAAAIIPLARVAVNLGFTFTTNNGALLLLDEQREECFYLIPTIDRKVFVTTCRDAVFSGKASSNLSPYDGRFLECDEVADFVSVACRNGDEPRQPHDSLHI